MEDYLSLRDRPKSCYFTAVGSSSVKTVADMHRLVVYRNNNCWRAFKGYSHSVDFERPWTSKIKGFSDFSVCKFSAARHTSRFSCYEIDDQNNLRTETIVNCRASIFQGHLMSSRLVLIKSSSAVLVTVRSAIVFTLKWLILAAHLVKRYPYSTLTYGGPGLLKSRRSDFKPLKCIRSMLKIL